MWVQGHKQCTHTRQRARELVAVQHAKVSEADGEITVRADAVSEHQAVPWAVHRLQDTWIKQRRISEIWDKGTSQQFKLQQAGCTKHAPSSRNRSPPRQT